MFAWLQSVLSLEIPRRYSSPFYYFISVWSTIKRISLPRTTACFSCLLSLDTKHKLVFKPSAFKTNGLKTFGLTYQPTYLQCGRKLITLAMVLHEHAGVVG